jgi:hypothetical protein
MRDLINWKDRQVEFPDRVKLTDLGGGFYTIEKAPGTIEEPGTPQNKENFNSMDVGTFEALMIAEEALRHGLLMQRDIDGLDAEIHEVTIANSYAYPFNSSVYTVQLDKLRNKTSYTVTYEVVSVTGDPGCSAGDVVIYDKLANGFKVHFTGSATSVVLKLYVRGGF